jgi:hypothetical protein
VPSAQIVAGIATKGYDSLERSRKLQEQETMLMRIINMILSLFTGNRSGQSGVNLADGIDVNDVMGILEQVMSQNGGQLNLPQGVIPNNVAQQIQDHYQTNGTLSNFPMQSLPQQHVQAIQQHLNNSGAHLGSGTAAGQAAVAQKGKK